MEKAGSFNGTGISVPQDRVQYHSTSQFPAWVPAVTVAVSMLMFLAGSFYCRHRKVIKKRQILMDYFYVIFQYGGTRRKRMVAALCNTNSITLRELGRSFMLSFDSFANTDNSCPFFTDDAVCSIPCAITPSPLSQKKSFFRNRGMTITRKYRGPFIRINSQPDDNSQSGALSFQDIVMKFKGKRSHGNPVSGPVTPSRRLNVSPQYEGSSMCTIHGDDLDYQNFCGDTEVPATYNRQRRNAFVLPCDPAYSKYSEVYGEVGRHSLGQVLPESYRTQQGSFSGKRNSEPFQNQHCYPPGQSQCCEQHPYFFHVHNEQLSPNNVVCGSQGFISKSCEQSECCQYRNSEPTILIHSPSTETETIQGWSTIRSRNTNGIVFLKRVPKPGGAPGEFYYEEQKSPSPDLSRRVSLSKVSYVPSGNMNEYYNCLHNNIKQDTSNANKPADNKLSSTNPPGTSQGPSKSKRSRLSLGDLAISNFNRRIDLGSDSLQEQETDQSSENRGSHDLSRPMPNITWTKLKNVFTGSRAAQALQNQSKVKKSFSLKQERQKRRRNRRSTSWQRFVSMFTGFRSLPETKKSSTSVDIPKSSNSYPLGLDINVTSYEDASEPGDQESDAESRPIELHRRIYELRQSASSSAASRISYERVASSEENEMLPRAWERPNALSLSAKTHSFPEELMHGHHYCQRSKAACDGSRRIQSPLGQTARTNGRRHRKRNDRVVASLTSLPQTNLDYNCYAFQAGYSPANEEYRFRIPASTGNKAGVRIPEMVGCTGDSQNSIQNNGFKQLSPLPEIHFGVQEKVKPHIFNDLNFDSPSDPSAFWTPDENGSTHQRNKQANFVSNDQLNIINETSSHHDKSGTCVQLINDIDHDSVTADYGPYHFMDCTSGNLSSEHTQTTDTFETASMKSSLANLTEDMSDSFNIATSINSLFDSKDSLSHACCLALEHKRHCLSSDSIYYDTASIFDTSSLNENKNIIDIVKLASEYTQGSVNQQHEDFAAGIVHGHSVLLNNPMPISYMSHQRSPELQLAPLPNYNAGKTVTTEAINTHALHKAESSPVLLANGLLTQCSSVGDIKRWSSYPLNRKAQLGTPNSPYQYSHPDFNKQTNPVATSDTKRVSLAMNLATSNTVSLCDHSEHGDFSTKTNQCLVSSSRQPRASVRALQGEYDVILRL